MRWVSYTRAVSCIETDMPPADIINQQNRHIQEFMAAHGWMIEKKYSDRKCSKDATEAFEQMVQDGMRRDFDGIVVDSVFRCGRDLWAARDILARTFYPAGISFAIAEDGWYSGGKTTDEVEEYFSGKRALFVSFNNGKLFQQQIADGSAASRCCWYGYRVSDNDMLLEIDEESAAVVRLIYRKFLEGKTYAEIRDDLNGQGICPPQEQKSRSARKELHVTAQGRWYSNAVTKILSDSVYIGEWKCVVNGKTLISPVPQIVTKEVFEKTQEIIKQNRQKKRARASSPYLILVRHIFDQDSGEALHCLPSPLEDGRFVYWLSRNCTQEDRQKMIPLETVLYTVREKLEIAASQACYVDQLLKNGAGQIFEEERDSHVRREAERLFAELDDACRNRIQIHKQFEAGGMDVQIFEAKEKEYQEFFRQNESGFQRIKTEVETIRITFSHRNPWVHLFCNAEIPESLGREHIKKYVDRVLVDSNKNIEVVLKSAEWMDRLPKEWLLAGMEE
ncbi:MAG: recombinase family protein [Clostridiales bacterium]|nr:recombinase family protein [Clostridiales bacterium]